MLFSSTNKQNIRRDFSKKKTLTEKEESVHLLHQLRGFFVEIPDRDCRMYNDIFEHNFLSVVEDDLRYSYEDQDRIQYEIFSVLSSCGNKYRWATAKKNSAWKQRMFTDEMLTK